MADVYAEGAWMTQDTSSAVGIPVNRKKVFESLKKSIEAHKNRMAAARIKKGVFISSDLKNADRGKHVDCRNTNSYGKTAAPSMDYKRTGHLSNFTDSVNSYNGPVGHRSYTKIINKINKRRIRDDPYETKEHLKVRPIEVKVESTAVKDAPSVIPTENNGHNIHKAAADPASVNPTGDDSITYKELEDAIMKSLMKVLLEKVNGLNLTQTLKEEKTPASNVSQDNSGDKFVVTKSDDIAKIITKCISTSINACENEKQNRSVKVEINLNIPNLDTLVEPVDGHRSTKSNDTGNVSDNGEEGNNESRLSKFFNIFKNLNFCTSKAQRRANTANLSDAATEEPDIAGNTPFIKRNVTAGFIPRNLIENVKNYEFPVDEVGSQFMKSVREIPTIRTVESPFVERGGRHVAQSVHNHVPTPIAKSAIPHMTNPNVTPFGGRMFSTPFNPPLPPRQNTLCVFRPRCNTNRKSTEREFQQHLSTPKVIGFARVGATPSCRYNGGVMPSISPSASYYVRRYLMDTKNVLNTLNHMSRVNNLT